jgi:hypothetical protein
VFPTHGLDPAQPLTPGQPVARGDILRVNDEISFSRFPAKAEIEYRSSF